MRIIWDVQFSVYKSGSLSFRETSWTFEMKLKLKQHATKSNPSANANLLTHIPDGQRAPTNGC